MRITPDWLDSDGDIKPGFFRNRPKAPSAGMSCDWEKYSTAEESRQRARNPATNGVLSMVAGQVREVPRQRLEHDPVKELESTPPIVNRAHSQVFGEKTPEVRLKLRRITTWLIKIPR
jgi:hypothetical protein